MIAISGYMYDVTLGMPIDMSLRTYTIGCMSDYDGGVLSTLTGTSAYYAALYIRNSNPGQLPLTYIVTDPTSGLVVSGIVVESNFEYDSNNVLVWLNKYYDVLKRTYGSAHTIRFCRDSNPDEWYMEINYDIHGNDIILYTNGQRVILSNITFETTDYSVYMFDYSDTIAGNKPTGADETFYIGSIKTGSNFALYKCTPAALASFTVNDDTYLTSAIGEIGTMDVLVPPDTIRHVTKTTVRRVIYLVMEHFYVSSAFPNQSIIAVLAPDGEITDGEVYFESTPSGPSGPSSTLSFEYDGHTWLCTSGYGLPLAEYGGATITNNHNYECNGADRITACQNVLSFLDARYYPPSSEIRLHYYAFLILDPRYYEAPEAPEEPGSDVDPDNPPDPDEPSIPSRPDDPDPYYDPTSDPDSPEYKPTKDPDSPAYDPSEPDTPYRPPTTEGGGDPPIKTPEDPVLPPPTPPAHAINSRFVTLYTPSLSQLNDLAAYLWSPAWSVDGFKKIFANPMDCILGLMIFPALASPSGSKEVNVGNLSTGVTMSYIDNQYVELNCGSFEVKEYYASYLDYDPYTKIEIYLPYIGTHKISADDVMNKTIQLKYMIDLLSGACVAFLVVDGTTLYTFTGSCATPIPVSGNDWSNMVNGILSVAGAATAAVISGGTAASMAAGVVASSSLVVNSHKEHIRHGGSVASAAGLMSIQKPYLIITHPRQALPIGQNSFQGYPSFMTESLGSLSGYTEVESCHLEHVPCTDEELKEIERLLKGGVLF